MTVPAAGPRVLVVAPLYHPDRGGLGRQAVLLTERLAALGARPRVVTRRMLGLPPRAPSPAVPVHEVDAGRPWVHNYERADVANLATSLRFTAGLVRHLAATRADYDLVHVHGASLPLLGALPALTALGRPVVAKVAALHQGVEAGDLRGHWGPLGPAFARALRRVDAWVATTAEIADALAAEGYARARIARIPNFVDPARFRPPTAAERRAARASLGLGEEVVVLCAGRLTARKCVDALLAAFARAAGAVQAGAAPAPRLVVLGDGPERARLEALAARLPGRPRVRFDGFAVDVERWLRAADVFALPSRIEGLPNALLEALATGLAAVATDLGGCREVLAPEREGLLVPVGDVDALAAALARLLADAPLRARLGAAAAARVAGSYGLDAVAPRYLDLYRRVLTGAPPAG